MRSTAVWGIDYVSISKTQTCVVLMDLANTVSVLSYIQSSIKINMSPGPTRLSKTIIMETSLKGVFFLTL